MPSPTPSAPIADPVGPFQHPDQSTAKALELAGYGRRDVGTHGHRDTYHRASGLSLGVYLSGNVLQARAFCDAIRLMAAIDISEKATYRATVLMSWAEFSATMSPDLCQRAAELAVGEAFDAHGVRFQRIDIDELCAGFCGSSFAMLLVSTEHYRPTLIGEHGSAAALLADAYDAAQEARGDDRRAWRGVAAVTTQTAEPAKAGAK